MNKRIGHIVCWLTLFMVLVGTFNAIARYLGKFIHANLSSNAYLEIQWYLFSIIFLLGAASTFRKNGHVRVDVFYERLSERGKAWIDLLGTVFFLIPFSVFMIWASWGTVHDSWMIKEASPDPGGLPRYPIKTCIPIGFLLLILQGLLYGVKKWRFLFRQNARSDGVVE
ncbi:MAG: TRAP transporter small permease subunit [Kiritimatiellae bacterium]|nr:TRAP transporter small permease subunit [Kiritimatiellia bacterium]